VSPTLRELRALEQFGPALSQAVERGRPAHVADLTTSLCGKELIELAARLVRTEGASVAVLPTPTNRGVIFVPV
jgi:hypothetical protein